MIKTFYKNITIEQLNIASLLAVSILVIVYLFLSDNVATANFRKITLQKNINNLMMEIKNLNFELADKRSIGFLKKSAKELNLVVNESIQYIKVTGPVAKQ